MVDSPPEHGSNTSSRSWVAQGSGECVRELSLTGSLYEMGGMRVGVFLLLSAYVILI